MVSQSLKKNVTDRFCGERTILARQLSLRSDQNSILGGVKLSLVHSSPDSAPILPDSQNHTYLGTASRKVQQVHRSLSSRNVLQSQSWSEVACRNMPEQSRGWILNPFSSCGTVLDFWSNGHRRRRHILRQAKMKWTKKTGKHLNHTDAYTPKPRAKQMAKANRYNKYLKQLLSKHRASRSDTQIVMPSSTKKTQGRSKFKIKHF